MYKLLVVIILGLSSFSFSQDGDYIVTNEGEKLFCTMEKTNQKRIKVSIDGESHAFKADEIKGYRKGAITYVSGKVDIIGYGAKGWYYLEVLVEGEMNLWKVATSSRETGTQGNSYTSTKTFLFVNLTSDESGDNLKLMSSFWKKKLKRFGSSCPAFVEKVDALYNSDYGSESKIVDAVEAYNNCGE